MKYKEVHVCVHVRVITLASDKLTVTTKEVT